jgi:hypothetical protein
VRIGDQKDLVFLAKIVSEFGPFDIIIDDGSHKTADQISTFQYLFAKGLGNSGIYIVEDVHTNYWPLYRNSKLSFVDYAKGLIDLMHSHYVGLSDTQAVFTAKDLRVPLATVTLDSISFYDSIIVLRRANGMRSVPRMLYHT